MRKFLARTCDAPEQPADAAPAVRRCSNPRLVLTQAVPLSDQFPGEVFAVGLASESVASGWTEAVGDERYPNGWGRWRVALWLVICLAAGLVLANRVAAQPPQTTSPEEVVVLRNGGTFVGRVRETVDRLVVQLDVGGEIRLRPQEVDFRAPSLHDAYAMLARRNVSGEGRYHLGLCDWCLAQTLLPEAQTQMTLASRAGVPTAAIEARQARLDQIRRQMVVRERSRAEVGPDAFGRTPTKTNSPPNRLVGVTREGSGSEQRRGETRQTPQNAKPPVIDPADSVSAADKFAEVMPERLQLEYLHDVQPRLLHGCSASRCHGPAAQGGFELERTARGQPVTRRMSRRNLVALLPLIEPTEARESRLLELLREPHPGQQPPIYARETEHYEKIAVWVDEVSEFAMSLGELADATPHGEQTAGARREAGEGRPAGIIGRLPRTLVEVPETNKPRQQPASIPTYEDFIISAEERQKQAGQREGTRASRQEGGSTGTSSLDQQVKQAGFWDADERETGRRGGMNGDTNDRFTPVDPFDPEIFNRYVRDKQNSQESASASVPRPESPTLAPGTPVLEGNAGQLMPPARENSPANKADKK